MDKLGDEMNKAGVLSRGNSGENPVCPTENLTSLDDNRDQLSQNFSTGNEDLEAAEKLILKWDMASDTASQFMLFEGQSEEAENYLKSVDEVQKLMDSVSLSEANVNKTQNLLQLAMSRLEEEFRQILVVHSEPLDPELVYNPASMASYMSMASYRSRTSTSSDGFLYRESNSSDEDDEAAEEEEDVAVSHPLTDGICELDLIPQDAISDLHRIAERMVSAGYVRECMQVYGSIRKAMVDESLDRL
ncbi:hypothetical protein KI387_010397, partial [Taxus chinensis]